MRKTDYYEFSTDLLREYLSNMVASFSIKYVFICGGAGESSKRNQFKRYFNKNYKDSDIVLVYAENFAKVRALFYEKRKDKNSPKDKDDLLSLENFLSEFCECILIFLESPGSLAELGAFSNIDNILTKILVVNDYSHKTESSFINDGPIRKINLKSIFSPVMYYHNDYFLECIDDVIGRIEKCTNRREPIFALKDVDYDHNRVYKICLIIKFLGILSPVTKVEATKIFKRINIFNKDVEARENEFFFDFVLSMGLFKIEGENEYIFPLHPFNNILKERTNSYKLFNYRAQIIKYYNRNDKKRLSIIKRCIDDNDDYLEIINGCN